LHPLGLAVTGSTVWVLSAGNQTLDKYDAETATQTGSVDVPTGATSVVAGGGFVWVTAPKQIVRVAPDASRGSGVVSVPLADQPVDVAATTTATWVALRSGELVNLDPRDPSRTIARVAVDATPTSLTALVDGSAVVATTAGTSLASSGSLLVGVSSQTALLYATEVPS
jgi:hypothetical protein